MTTNSFANISTQQLRRAADLQEKIESLQGQLSEILGAPAVQAAPSGNGRRKKKRTMSASARAKIGAAQRARWAKQKAGKPGKTAKAAPKKARRKISAAARARMIAGAKARWAKIRAAKQAA